MQLRHLLLGQQREADGMLPHPTVPTQHHQTIVLGEGSGGRGGEEGEGRGGEGRGGGGGRGGEGRGGQGYKSN